MPKAFIHLGAHKTASSFFQANLTANAAAFERQGWRAVDLQREFPDIKNYLIRVRANEPLNKAHRNRFDDVFRQLREEPRDIFLSYEGFLGSMSMQSGEIYPNHAAQMEKLKEWFGGRDIRIGFCVRNFADQVESSYNFYVAMGRTTQSFAEYVKKISAEKLSWLKIVEQLSNTFGAENLVLWTYEDFKQDSIAAFTKIVRAAGIDTSDIAATVTNPKNVSLPTEKVRVLRAWFETIDSNLKASKSETRALKGKLRVLLRWFPHISEKGGHFKPKKRKKLTEHYEREIAAIREKWGKQMLDFGPSSPPKEAPGLQETSTPTMTV